MTYGLLIRNSSNSVTLDTSSYSMRSVYSSILTTPPAVNTELDIWVPGMDPNNSYAWCSYEGSVPTYVDLPRVRVSGDHVYITRWDTNYTIRLFVVAF